MQSDCGRPENWFEVATSFIQGDVNVPLFNVYIDIIVRAFDQPLGGEMVVQNRWPYQGMPQA